ncbi:MAG: hypothetical protein FWH02_08235 [Oscillospiraceae bacterium]|nr:hypothetical protein [Oscillospiraceae bacterium]
MNIRARVSLFLIEQLAAVTIFAVCAAVCASIFAQAYFTAADARDLNYALLAAKNAAEAYRSSGSPEAAARQLGAHTASSPDEAAVYYDSDWRICTEAEAAYVLRMASVDDDSAVLLCSLSVQRKSGTEIIAFTVASDRGQADG